MGSYVPVTEQEEKEMLRAIGCETIDRLFDGIPEEIRLREGLKLPPGQSELQVRRRMTELAEENVVFPTIFRGAGSYRHYIPAIVKGITSKEEFVTAYTPYQAEISQGILQSIFEYQTMICELTGMDVSNASVYDGATAAAESLAMCRERKRETAYVSTTVDPKVRSVLETYSHGSGMKLVWIPEKDGRTDLEFLREKLDGTSACVLIQQPNYYGLVEDADQIGEAAHEAGAKFVMSVNPISLGILKTPGEYGADVAVGEGQPLGIPMGMGGPYLGFMAATAKMMRRLPGRIVGETKDRDGKRAWVLTLQAREQHIRREKASSNICSNEALCALTASVYLAAMGPEGLAEAATQCRAKAHYMAAALAEAGFVRADDGEFFHEFATTSPIPVPEALRALEEKGILGGCPLDGEREGQILWCCTELNTKEEIDRAVAILKEVQS